ncbi:MAG TPA: TetR/AcrR family transcriptional regulator [Gemmatimonadaceae bacterium]|nr:TetR/AcrR family transcriptional regulator [Gemmatimonadaceae bacterium]
MSKGAETRQAILDRALDLSSVVGLEGVSIGRLADEMELSKSGLFAHFGSKEALQIGVLEAAAERFVDIVVRPALKAPRGERRVRALLERWLEWARVLPGGCVFVTAAVELDDRPGPVRDTLVRLQRDWVDVLTTSVRAAVESGEFRPTLDAARFAQEIYGLALAHYHFSRLLGDADSEARTRASFEEMVARARAS